MSIDEIKQALAAKGKASFHIKVSPGADRTEWQEPLADGTLRLKVKSAPERGKANDEVVSFVASELGVKKKDVEITAGGGARLKRLKARKGR